MGRAGVAGAGLVVVGAASIAAAVVADLGRWPYWGGIVLLVVGIGLLLPRLVRRPIVLVAACLAVALVVGGAGWLALHGTPDRHPTWPEDQRYHVSGDAGRLGDTWFTGAAAYDTTTGEVRWTAWGDGKEPSTADDIDLVALTDSSVISIEPSGTRGRGRLVARAPANGSEKWSVPTHLGRGVAVDGGVLVLNTWEGTRAHSLRTGKQLWSSPKPSAAECQLVNLRWPHGVAREQRAVVAMDEDDPDATTDLVRVADGKVISSRVSCLNGAHVVGDALIHADDTRVEALSVEDGARMWRASEDVLPSAWALSGSAPTVFIPHDDRHATGDEELSHYDAIEVATGEATETSPPDGWQVLHDETRDQRGEQVWTVVSRPVGDTGLWELGTDRVVEVPGTLVDPDLVTGPGGWVALSAKVPDLVGDAQPRAWALSPTGELHGPYSGPDAYRGVTVGPGVLQVGSRVHPLG